METLKASKKAWKHVICCLILLLIFVLTIGIHINAEGFMDATLQSEESSDVVPLRASASYLVAQSGYLEENEVKIAGPKKEVTVELRKVDYYITTYADEIKFFAKTFGVRYEDIIDDLHKRYDASTEEFDEKNIGFLRNEKGNLKTFNNVEYGIVEYFYDFVEKHPKKVSNKRVPYSKDSKYVENLIIYFTTHIYKNVDTKTALSIGAAESGYYRVKSMLRSNNVYGGMSSKGLIKYKNIEYGVLSYIRLLSKNYYGRGLNTVDKIGKKYCPKYDDNGNKIASPHWINLVKAAINKYEKYNLNVSMDDVLNSKGY